MNKLEEYQGELPEASIELGRKLVWDDVLKSFPTGGFFVEAGPGLYDTLLPLTDYGWRGMFVEPVEEILSTIPDKPGILRENQALADFEGEHAFYLLPRDICDKQEEKQTSYNTEYLQSLGSLRTGHPVIREWALDYAVEQRTVRCTTFDALMLSYGVSQVDLLKLSAVGYDQIILDAVDFDRIRPTVIMFEYKWLSLKELHELILKLEGLGYVLTFCGKHNLVAHQTQHTGQIRVL